MLTFWHYYLLYNYLISIERDETLVHQWLKTAYPKIRKMAKAQAADIYFGDAAHIRSDHHAGRSWGKRGETPVVATTGAACHEPALGDHLERPHALHGQGRGWRERRGLHRVSKRLLVGATRPIFLIVDRGPAHRAKKTQAFVESLGGKLRLFFLPPYSPDRNPDELVWKHLKADTVGRMLVTGYTQF